MATRPRPHREIHTAKIRLGWDPSHNNDKYRAWRKRVQDECIRRKITLKSNASAADWQELTTFAMNDHDFRMKAACELEGPEGPLRKHLDIILIDAAKKLNTEARNVRPRIETNSRVRARAEAGLSDSEAEDNDYPKKSRPKVRIPVRLCWIWIRTKRVCL